MVPINCLGLETRKNMIDNDCKISIARQCDLLLINKSTYYYQKKGLTQRDLEIMNTIDEILTLRKISKMYLNALE